MTETVQTALEAPGPAATENCPTCCTPRTGSYCSECGQRFRAGRLTLVRMAADVLASTFDLDRGMPLTTVALFRRPGQVVRAFVNGATGRYRVRRGGGALSGGVSNPEECAYVP